IPGFDTLKQAAKKAGALGSGISGSGPSVFALSRGRETAERVADALCTIYDIISLPYEIHVSAVNPEGVRILS
ncbi:MAG TPA: hypothetical protein VK183_06575, partial [Flavobacterium sp.]|nr:hypothetical protein [Flavobacterium sp.]